MSKYVRDWQWGTQYPNFKKSEFKCPDCGGYGNGIANSLVVDLQTLRDKYGSLVITSGYRCPSYNKHVGGVNNSKHLVGQAADFYFRSGILGNQNTRISIVNEIKRMPYVNYTYCNVNGNHPNMGNAIHMDTNLVDTDVMDWQRMMNGQYNAGLAVDGIFGNASSEAAKKNYLGKGKNAPLHVTWLQKQLAWRGYDLGKYGIDGNFGNDTNRAVRQFQKDHGLVVDGYVGVETTKKLLFE